MNRPSASPARPAQPGPPEPLAHFAWPFFEAHHRDLARSASEWATAHVNEPVGREVDDACRALVRDLGQAGWLRYAIAGSRFGGVRETIDVRALCVLREVLARRSGLADFAFAMQGLGCGPITLHGSEEQKRRYLPRVAKGEAIPAFALSEPDAGSDVAAISCTARIDGSEFVLDGEKTWISNGTIADFVVVFARTGEAPGARGLSAFVVETGIPGFTVAERLDVLAPHPLARLRLDGCRIPAAQLIGERGSGFRVAMATLDVFRTSVAAAALGLHRRALDESLHRAVRRRVFGQALADLQLTQLKLATMATDLDASTLLTYRAAWLRDQGAAVTREAAMAKLTATENAQRAIDAAVQIHGALGVLTDHPVERLYREIRALRIYEGATEVQLMIVARELLKTARAQEGFTS